MALGVNEPAAGRTTAEAVGRHLATRRALLALDNCEHVVAAAAEVAGAVLAAAPAVRVATSREPLGVGGEVTWAVPPLSEAHGVELFTTRARQARPRLRLGDEDTAAVRSICRRLDGLPLAIEVAAARTRALAPARIAAHLHDHMRVLPGGPRTAARVSGGVVGPGSNAAPWPGTKVGHKLVQSQTRIIRLRIRRLGKSFRARATSNGA